MNVTTWCMFAILFLYAALGVCIYRKIFGRTCHNVFNGIMRELFFVALFAVVLIGLTLYFWKVAVVLIIVAAVCAAIKAKNSLHQAVIAIAAVLICVLICVCGSSLHGGGSDDGASIVMPDEEKASLLLE